MSNYYNLRTKIMDRKSKKAMEDTAAEDIYMFQTAASMFALAATEIDENQKKAAKTLQGVRAIQSIYNPDADLDLKKYEDLEFGEKLRISLGGHIASSTGEFTFSPIPLKELDEEGKETDIDIKGSDDAFTVGASKVRSIGKLYPYLEGTPREKREIVQTLIDVPSIKKTSVSFKVDDGVEQIGKTKKQETWDKTRE
jgi:hypothetical protein